MAVFHSTQRNPRAKDETGNVYGKLTVVGLVGARRGRLIWKCRCCCGKTTEVPGVQLRNGQRTSCSHACSASVHGCARRNKQTPEFQCWKSMLGRCYGANDTNFRNYGSRGIVVCERWRYSFVNFLADMGMRPSPRHSIDRIDNDGNYEPGNCRWATKEIQDNNRRTNRMITFEGETQSLTQWARSLGIHPVTLYYRLTKLKWPLAKAMTTRRPT